MEGPAGRLAGLDALRFFAAFSVVTLHIEPYDALPRTVLEAVWSLARYAVPAFFLLSGFFAYPKLRQDPGSVLKSLTKLLQIQVVACAAYVPWQVLRGSAISDLLTPGILVSGTAFHLWFPPALGVALLVLAVALSTGRVVWIGCFGGLVLIAYAASNLFGLGEPANDALLRFLSGIPLVGIGAFMRRGDAMGIGLRGAAMILTVGIVLQSVEAFVVRPRFDGASQIFQFGFGSVLVAVALVVAGMRLSERRVPGLGCLGRLGAKYSLGIYVWHVWWISILKQPLEVLGIMDTVLIQASMAPAAFLAAIGGLAASAGGLRWIRSKRYQKRARVIES